MDFIGVNVMDTLIEKGQDNDFVSVEKSLMMEIQSKRFCDLSNMESQN